MIRTQSAGAVIKNHKNEVIVVSQVGTSWSLPKGHLEKDEDKFQALKRELYEETGIKDFKIVKELGSYNRFRLDEKGKEDKSEQKTIFMYLVEIDKYELNPIDPENPEARWVKKEEVADQLTAKEDKNFFLSIINKI